MMRNVAIVGSGLTAISAAKVLITRGVKPVIIDIGNTPCVISDIFSIGGLGLKTLSNIMNPE